ncbi:hypothetical protein LPQ06_28505, partial [Klebsiella pneumoniae]|nr:hypothetical protein [Klebsiella pneumoniae]
GGRGSASRLGHKTRGLRTTCNAWNVGVRCYASVRAHDDGDVIDIELTRGSSGHGVEVGIRYYLEAGEPRVEFCAKLPELMGAEGMRRMWVDYAAYLKRVGSEPTAAMLDIANAMCDANPQFAAAFLSSAMARVEG